MDGSRGDLRFPVRPFGLRWVSVDWLPECETGGLLQKLSLGAAEDVDLRRKIDGLRLNVVGRVEGIEVDFKVRNTGDRSLVDINIFG